MFVYTQLKKLCNYIHIHGTRAVLAHFVVRLEPRRSLRYGRESVFRAHVGPTHSSGTSYGHTRGRPAADPSPENSSKRLFPKTRYTMRAGPYQLDPRKGTITTWIRRDRIPNEKTPRHEATNKSSVP
ncbi:hypothetical protein EVAR_38470_1 [Eumeta japonica]|uniref:Uncharacterized protein n=1 Tax=Eumeta variegata TaxID=151549 RepID=A0A4C1WQE5_EUMVA|nr:hypothetical protein EVAR_38470_1 [Eumeta japonica]